MESPAATAPPTQSAETDRLERTRCGCFDVFKQFGKSAWRKVGGTTREPRSNAIPVSEPPIQSVVVDIDDIENRPPVDRDELHGSGPLEVDTAEAPEFSFDTTLSVYLANASSRDRLSALCARYGLQYAEDNEVPGRLRVPRQSRQRVRIACHVCNAVFKGERVCQKCGHGKCGECPRRPLTEPRATSSDEAAVVSIDSSDDAKSTTSSVEVDAQPVSSIALDTSDPERQEPRPVIERSKYICHKCSGEFATVTNALCESCGHEKCVRCSRRVVHMPYPYDGPGATLSGPRQNRVYRPPKQRVRHYCDQCGSMFAPRTRTCGTCLHVRCENCTRHPRKRRKLTTGADADPEAVRAVEARMVSIVLSKTGSASDAGDGPVS